MQKAAPSILFPDAASEGRFMNLKSFDNQNELLKDGLIEAINNGDRISVAAALFSIYGYGELKKQLEACDSFRFIYT